MHFSGNNVYEGKEMQTEVWAFRLPMVILKVIHRNPVLGTTRTLKDEGIYRNILYVCILFCVLLSIFTKLSFRKLNLSSEEIFIKAKKSSN